MAGGIYYPQTAFNSGELSPRLAGRPDVERYKNGCKTLENFILYPHGGAKSRPGLRFVAEAKDPAHRVKLIPFIFSNVQAYVLEFGQYYIRFYKDQGQILDSVTLNPYEIVSPWASGDVMGLQYAQAADVLYIVHEDFPPYKLTRLAHDSWTLVQVDWQDGPYLTENDDGVTALRCNATSGTGITVHAETSGGLTTTGTYDDTLGAPEDFLTAARPFCVFIFTASGGELHSVKINVTTAAAVAQVVTAYLYASDGSKATGAVLGTSDTNDISSTGAKTFTFATTPTLTDGNDYAIVFDADIDETAKIDVVSDSADYVSGFAATATGAVTNLAALDWRLELSYQPIGNASVFVPGHVGSTWRIRHSGTRAITYLANEEDYVGPHEIRGKFYVDISTTTDAGSPWDWGRLVLEKSYNQIHWYEVAAFHYATKQEFFETANGVYYRVRLADLAGGAGGATATLSQAEQWGVFKITGYTNAHTVTADVISTIGSTAQSVLWREGAWSDYRGYPATVVFHDDRLCLASTDHQPYSFWGSWSGDYELMMPGDTDDSALDWTLSKLSNRIVWLESGNDPLVGTCGEEARLLVQKNAPLSITNPPKVAIQSKEGSAARMRTIQIGPAFLFVDQSRRKLFESAYSVETDTNIPNDLTLFAEHITESGIIDFSYAKNPDSILWCVRDDGDLIGFTYFRKENVLGWHRHTTIGEFESVATIPSSMGITAGHTESWFVVHRHLGDGTVKRYIELMEDHESITDKTSPVDYFCVDAGVTYDGTATNVVGGLYHLEGKSVAILADGIVYDRQVVAGGRIYLPEGVTASVIHVGSPYTPILQPLVPEITKPDGTSMGRMRHISEVTFKFKDTLGGQAGASADKLFEIPVLTPDVTLPGTAPVLKTGDFVMPWGGDWGPEESPMVVQGDPLPMTVLSMTSVVTVHD